MTVDLFAYGVLMIPELLQALTGYEPKVDLREGVRRFVAWYRDYYQV